MQVLTLFVSSPGDVRDERQAVGRIVERLQARYWNFIRLEPVLWEKEPLRATAHFNEELIRPSDCDLFVCILWSRLGSPLPSQFNRKDGTRFDSGTEWELEEATDAFEERAKQDPAKAKPDILVYRRMSEPPGGDPSQSVARSDQRKKLDGFCERFFFNPDKTIRRAFSPYESVDEFTTLFEQHLEKLLLRHIQLQRGLAQEAVRPLPLTGSPFKGLGTFDFEDAPLFFGRNRPIAEALAALKVNQAAGHAFLLIYGGSGYGKSSLMKAGLAPRLMAEGYLPQVGTWCGCGLRPVEGDSPPLETLARALVEALPDLAKLRDTSAGAAPEPPPAPAPAQQAKGKRGKKHRQPPPKPKPVAAVSPALWDSARLARTMGKREDLLFAIAAITAALDRASAGKPAHLLILVDQLEEIFTARGITAEMQDTWFHVLAALAMTGRIWVVATMRSEFFPRVPEHKDLFQLVRHGGGYILSPPELPELHQIIRYPALSAGLQFERHPGTGRDLSEQIYQDAADAGDALPLLEFTLEELYQRRRENVLTWSAYEELGGLSGAIARRAQETYDALPSEARREAARQIFGELVTLDAGNEGPATRRRARKEILYKAHPGAPGFVDAFVNAKLLVTGEEHGIAVVSLAHEALITHWPVLKQWIEDHRDLLLARRRLEDATRLWSTGGKPGKFLLTEGRLSEAERVVSCGVFAITPEEAELVALSQKRAKRKLRVFQGATVVFAGLAIAATVLGFMAREEKQQADIAKGKAVESAAATQRSLANADFDAGAARAEAGAPDEALPYLVSALENDPKQLDAQVLLLATLRRTAWHFPIVEIRHPLPVRQIAFGADPKTLYTSIDTGSSRDGFNTTLRWDLTKPSLAAVLMPTADELLPQGTQVLSLSPDGKRLIVERGNLAPDHVLLCDAQTLEPIRDLPFALGDTRSCFAWSAEGALLAYTVNVKVEGEEDSRLAWAIADANSGEVIRQTDGIKMEGVDPLTVQINRERLRALHSDGTLIELPLSPQLPATIYQQPGKRQFTKAILSPDGNTFLVHTPTYLSDPELDFYYIVPGANPGEFQFGAADTPTHRRWLDSAPLLKFAPWTQDNAPLWTKLLKADRPGQSLPTQQGTGEITIPSPLVVSGSSVGLADVVASRTLPVAPLHLDAQVTAASFDNERVATGTTSGQLLIHQALPRMDYSVEKPQPLAEEEVEGWWLFKTLPGGLRVEKGENATRLMAKDAAPVLLEVPQGWDTIVDLTLTPDGTRLVMGGYGGGMARNEASGMVLADAKTGRLISGREPIEFVHAARMEFLPGGRRLAVAGYSEVAIYELEGAALRKLTAIPVVQAIDLFPMAQAKYLAIATSARVTLHSLEDFSQVAVLPLVQPAAVDGLHPALDNPWAEDGQTGWLAFAAEQSLTIWTTPGGRALVSNFPVADGPLQISFATQDGFRGLKLDGAARGFIPLAKVDGVAKDEVAALKSLSQALGGTRFAEKNRSMLRLPRDARRAALGTDLEKLKTLFPGADLVAMRDGVLALDFKTPAPEAWLPLWQRLAASEAGQDLVRLARWSSALGDHPWRRQLLRAAIAQSDENLFALWRGEELPKPDDGSIWLPGDSEIGRLHEMAGDDAAQRQLKEASWTAARTMPERLGAMLADPEWLETFPDLDAEKLKKLDPAELEKARVAMLKERPEDERLNWLKEYVARPAAMALLEAQVTSTLAAHEAAPTRSTALAHARALALHGEMKAAAEFLEKQAPEDAPLTLEQAHFLVASDLGASARVDMPKAMPELASLWLWQEWLQVRARDPEQDLSALVQSTMAAVDGSGPAAVEALKLSLEHADAQAISACVQLAKGMPDIVKAYAMSSALWAEDKKAAAFGLWSGEFPDLAETAATRDWHGWERALPTTEEEDLFSEMRKELAALSPGENPGIEDLQALATRLLEPATSSTFGAKRVRDAMMSCAEALADDTASGDVVMKMVERARLAGAPPVACLRIEARVFMAANDFTSGFARWVQVLDAGEAETVPTDYLQAARCVMEDMQPEAGIELLTRGSKRFPTDSKYALQAAWMLLEREHPEDSGVMLEHGFAIPFKPQEQQQALAMLICAAEKTERKGRADEALAELIELNPNWDKDEFIQTLEWPEDFKQSLLEVAKRNR